MDDGPSQDRARIQREIATNGLRRAEVEVRANEAWKVSRPTQIDLAAPLDVRHPVSGRRDVIPTAELVAAGRLFWQARRRAGISQQRLAAKCGVSQSMISRFERGLAPAMGVRYLVAMANGLGRIFPFGTCPHDHECGWQPYKPPEVHTSYVTGWLDALLATESRSQPRKPEPADDDYGISVTLADLSGTLEDGRDG